MRRPEGTLIAADHGIGLAGFVGENTQTAAIATWRETHGLTCVHHNFGSQSDEF